MTKFSSLSKGKKRCVLALFETEPRLKVEWQIERKDIVSVWENLKSKGSKVGFPNWLLTKQFKNVDGYYVIPKPTEKDLEEYKNPTKKKKVLVKKQKKQAKSNDISIIRKEFEAGTLTQEDMEYYGTLNTYNIPF